MRPRAFGEVARIRDQVKTRAGTGTLRDSRSDLCKEISTMPDCEFLHRFVDCHRQCREVCSLNGRFCLVDPQVASIKDCTRRTWALSGFINQRPRGPEIPPGKVDAHGPPDPGGSAGT